MESAQDLEVKPMMGKRDEAPRPTGTTANPAPASAPPPPVGVSHEVEERNVTTTLGPREERQLMKEELASIGKSIVIKGELSGAEDLTIEGQVEGKIEFRDHVLTVGTSGRIKAEIVAKSIVVLGQVTGNLTATEKVDIKEKGSVEGDVTAPRVAIADGSHFRGTIDMQRKEQPASERTGSALTSELFVKPDASASKPVGTGANSELIRV